MQNSKEARYQELLEQLLELREELRTSRKPSTDAFLFAQAEEGINALLAGMERAVDAVVDSVLKRLDKLRKRKPKYQTIHPAGITCAAEGRVSVVKNSR